MRVLIIGGVAGGMSAATRLRRLREDAEIVVYEMSEHVSYANCGLPYYIGGVITDRKELLLQTPESLWSRFRIEVKVRSMVLSIDREAKTVEMKDLATGATSRDRYDKLVIATGARPRKLEIPGSELALSLRNVNDTDQIKHQVDARPGQRVVILGAGFIGLELAENLAGLGVDTTIVQRGTTVLGQFDPEMIEPLQQRLVEHGVKLALNAEPERIDETSVTLSDGRVLPADLVISAAGVNPDNALARAAGLEIGETGGLRVNEQQQTSDPDIFAAGDAVEKFGVLTGSQTLIPLANLANRHGRLVADAIAGLPVKASGAIGTVIIGAFGLATAITGLSEKAARRAGIKFQALHLHPGSHAGYYPGAKPVNLKVLFDPESGRILGAQANGEEGVDKRIDVLATAIHGGLSVDDLMDLELAYAPQFGSAKDAINQAGYVANNIWHGQTPTVQWQELTARMAAGAQLIDVRSASEFAAGAIPGAINIPVDELRDRMDEVLDDEVIVHCAVGQRGHTATQILRAKGKNALNLSGGYKTWKVGMAALERQAR